MAAATAKESSSSSSSAASATTSTSSPDEPLKNKINELVHQEPFESLGYGIFWLLILVVVTPFLAIVILFPLTLYRLMAWKFDYWNQRTKYDPKKTLREEELAILITGCDSGFGKDLALEAASGGYIVFAGCLNEESVKAYKDQSNIPNIKPLLMDVTSFKDVQDSLKHVQDWINDNENDNDENENKKGQKKRLLHALINNAGISIPNNLDLNGPMALNQAQKVMDVNYFGIIRTCQTFLPLFKEQRLSSLQQYKGGRIINVTSVAGLTPGGPGVWNYAASKHAAQCFSQGLSKELQPWSIGVTTINPGFHTTPIMSNTTNQFKNMWNHNTPIEIREQYGEEYLNNIITMIEKFMSWGFPPKQVTTEIIRVLKISKPPSQVLVGMDARYLFILTKLMPSWLSDLEPTTTTNIPLILQSQNQKENNKSDPSTTNEEKMKSQ